MFVQLLSTLKVNLVQGSQIRQIWRIYAKIVQMTPLKLRRESLRLQKFSVTNTLLSLPFSQQIQFTLIVNILNLN